jgi:hypothetical protein
MGIVAVLPVAASYFYSTGPGKLSVWQGLLDGLDLVAKNAPGRCARPSGSFARAAGCESSTSVLTATPPFSRAPDA